MRILLGFLFVISFPTLAYDIKEAMEAAGELYDNGNCSGAIEAYRKIHERNVLSQEDNELLVFRSAYCYLNIGQYDAAERGFSYILKRYPDHAEARIKLAQSYYGQKKLNQAREQALKIKDANYLAEATLFAVQIDLEQGDSRSAINRLEKAKFNDEWRPIFFYWKGVARYQHGQYDLAESYFRAAQNIAPEQLWVKKAAADWTTQLNKEKAWLSGSVTMGYIFDSNLGQMSILVTDSSGYAAETGPKPSSYYRDTAYYLSGDLNARLLYHPRLSLNSFVGWSSPFYRTYKSYNNENLNLGVASGYKLNQKASVGLSAKYLNARYNYNYSQDYLYLTPETSYAILPELLAHLEVPVTFYLRSRFSKTYGPSASLRYGFEGGSAVIGASYSHTEGQKGVYYGKANSASLVDGFMFSNYDSLGAFFGGTIYLPEDLILSTQVALYRTAYRSEDVSGYNDKSRDDSLHVYSGDLRKSLGEHWSVGATYTHSRNSSRGFQSLASTSYIADYNYSRDYWMFSTTVNF